MSDSFPTVTIPFSSLSCCKCGIPIVMFKEQLDRRRSDGEFFFCPAGHQQHYSDGEIATLKAEVTRLTRNLAKSDAALAEAETLAATKNPKARWFTQSEIADAIGARRSSIRWALNRLVAYKRASERPGAEGWRATEDKTATTQSPDAAILAWLRARAVDPRPRAWKALAKRLRKELGESRERAAFLRSEIAALKTAAPRTPPVIVPVKSGKPSNGTAPVMLPAGRGTPVL